MTTTTRQEAVDKIATIIDELLDPVNRLIDSRDIPIRVNTPPGELRQALLEAGEQVIEVPVPPGKDAYGFASYFHRTLQDLRPEFAISFDGRLFARLRPEDGTPRPLFPRAV